MKATFALKASEYAVLVAGNTLHLGNRVVVGLRALGAPLKDSTVPALDPERAASGSITSTVAPNGDYTVLVEWTARAAAPDDDEL